VKTFVVYVIQVVTTNIELRNKGYNYETHLWEGKFQTPYETEF